MPADGDSCPDQGMVPAAGPAAKRKPASPPHSTTAAAPGKKCGVPLTRPKQQVHKHRSYATIRKLEAELLAKQRQLGQLEQQHDQLCQNVRVLQQIVVSGQDVLQAAASGTSTLSTTQRQRLAALNSHVGWLTQEEELLHTLYTTSTKAVMHATDAMGFARLLSAATRYGKQLLAEGGPGIMQQDTYQRWAGALLAFKRACLTWNPDAFWGAASINLDTLRHAAPSHDHWRAVVAAWVDTATPEQIGLVQGNQRFLHKSMVALTQRLHGLVATLTTTQDFYCHYQCSQELGRLLQEYGSTRLLYGAHFAAGLGVCEFGRFVTLSWPYLLSVSGVGEALAELAPPSAAAAAAAPRRPRNLPRRVGVRRSSPGSDPGSSGSPSNHHQQQQPCEGALLGNAMRAPQGVGAADAATGGSGLSTLLPHPGASDPQGAASSGGAGPEPGSGRPAGLQLLLQPASAAAILQELSGRAADALRRQLRQEQAQQVQAWQGQLQQVAADYLQLLVGHLQQRQELWRDTLRPTEASLGGRSSLPELSAEPLAQQAALQHNQQHQHDDHHHHHHQQQQQQAAGGAEASWQAPLAGPGGELQLQQLLLDVEPGHLSALQDLLFCCRGVLAAPQYQALPGAPQVVASLEEQFVACLLEQQSPPLPLR